MADEVTTKPQHRRLKWLLGLLGLVGLASMLGPSTVGAHTEVEKSRAQLDARVLAVRGSLRVDDVAADRRRLPEKLGQWINYPSWGNWGNWPNWNNWNNWWNR